MTSCKSLGVSSGIQWHSKGLNVHIHFWLPGRRRQTRKLCPWLTRPIMPHKPLQYKLIRECNSGHKHYICRELFFRRAFIHGACERAPRGRPWRQGGLTGADRRSLGNGPGPDAGPQLTNKIGFCTWKVGQGYGEEAETNASRDPRASISGAIMQM